MKVLLQRVSSAQVDVDGACVGKIGKGLLAFVGVERHDDEALAEKMARRVAGYRLFSDHEGKMNLDVRDLEGEILAVSQFTLAADTRKGRRPSFSCAATPEQGLRLYEHFVDSVRREGVCVATGIFAADMQVTLTNEGPVTFLLEL